MAPSSGIYGKLPRNYHQTTLGDVCEAGGIQTGPFGSQLHKKDYVESGTPIVTVEHLGDNRFTHQNLPFVSVSDAERLAKYRLREGDIVFSRVGSVDRRALVRQTEDGWLFSGRCLRVRPCREIVDPTWLSYLLGSEQFCDYIRGVAVGATMPSINTKILSQAPVFVPPMSHQLATAEILDSIDSRIGNLRQTNSALEDIAQALFKSWFVDFDPVRAKAEGREPEGMDAGTAALFPSAFEDYGRGLMPEGWCRVPSAEIYDVGIGKTPPRKEPQWFSESPEDIRWVSIRDMGDSGCFLANTSEYLTEEAVSRFKVRVVPDGTVLLSFKLTVGRLAITDGPMTTNEAIAHFKASPSSLPPAYLYCYLRSFDMTSLASTSSIATATNSRAIRELALLHPGSEVAAAFDRISAPLFEQIRNQQRKATTLCKIRDTLLPRLISGKLRLPEAEARVEALA